MSLKRWALIAAALILLVTGGAAALLYPWLTAILGRAAGPLPTIVVEATYPGASAQIVADSIAAPIEQQVNGVEGMRSMVSQSRGDGTYTLTVAFKRGFDPNMAQVLVQNRISIAFPMLPESIKNAGVTVAKKSPYTLLFVALTSPDDRYDDIYLSNYATINFRDKLARVAGVGGVELVGHREHVLRIDLDAEKLASHGLITDDVVKSLRENKLEIANNGLNLTLGRIGSTLTVKQPTRSIKADGLAELLLKIDEKGNTVRLRDVSRLELEVDGASRSVRVSGKPAVLLAIQPLPGVDPRKLARDIEETLTTLRAQLPSGVADSVVGDFTASNHPEFLRFDLTLPDGASAEQTLETVQHFEQLASSTVGVQDVMAMCGPPFGPLANEAVVLVRLKQGREPNRGRTEMIQALRSRARKELNEAAVRVCDLTSSYGFTVDGYPVDLMIQDETRDGTSVHLAEVLAERLRQNDKITDVWVTNRPRQHRLTVDIDRAKTIALGVDIGDILETLQAQQKGLYVDDMNRLGHIVRACVPGPDLSPKRIEDLRQLQVRNNQGTLVALSSLATIQTNDELGVIERWNLYSCVHVIANPAPGVPVTEARKLCETAAEEARKELGLSDKWQFTFAPP